MADDDTPGHDAGGGEPGLESNAFPDRDDDRFFGYHVGGREYRQAHGTSN
jgi:hypothetical protein